MNIKTRIHEAVFLPIEKTLDLVFPADTLRRTERVNTAQRRESTMLTSDPHNNEYLAAIQGLHEQTPSPVSALDAFAVGDHVSFRLADWSPASFDDGGVIGHHAGKLLVETASDIVEVDPRPWPEGNVLPF
jgi:hypothetical protein